MAKVKAGLLKLLKKKKQQPSAVGTGTPNERASSPAAMPSRAVRDGKMPASVDAGAREGAHRQATAAEAKEVRHALDDMAQKLQQITTHAAKLTERAEDEATATSGGVSLLEVKVQLMLQYNTALGLVVMLKLHGRSIEDHPIIDRLVTLRTMLEKIRPIEAKLKYQLDRLVRAATEGTARSADLLRHRPQAQNLVPKLGAAHQSGQASENDAEAETSTGGAYVMPKLAAVPYDEDDTAEVKRKKREDKERAKFLNSEMMQELRSEFSVRPEEVSHADTFKDSIREEMQEREKVEESRFVRLPGRKKLLKKRERISSGMEDITSFAGTRGMLQEERAGSKKLSMREQLADVQRQKKRKRK